MRQGPVVIWRSKRRSTGIRQFVKETPTVLLPAHDDDVARRLASGEPMTI